MKTLFWKKIFFNSGSDFAKSRSAIYSVSSKAITTKNEFSLYRKSQENRAEKKNGSEKLIKSPRNRLAGALSNKPLVRFIYPNLEKETSVRRIHFILHVVVISRTERGSLIAMIISSTLQKPQQNRPARVLAFRSNIMTIQYQ